MRDNSGLLGVLAGGSQLLVSQSFSQDYEFEADDVGWQYLVAARIDPRGLSDMLRKLKAEQEKMLLAQVAPQAFSSHPATDKRLRRLDRKWEKLKDKSGFIEYDVGKGKL
jgi:predicted Zn-dependent protease